MPRPASGFLPAVILHIQCHINKWKEKLCLEHGSFSLVPASVVSQWQICFALVLLKDSPQYLSSFIKERLSCSLTWQRTVVCLAFNSVVLYSCFSHEPALVHALLIPKPSNTISLLGLCKSDHINSLLLPAKPRNIFVIFNFRCEVYSALQGRFALAVYLQDFYFPFSPKHFFLDRESCFGRFRRRSQAAHPGSSAVTNTRAPGRQRHRGSLGAGTGTRSVLQRRLQPARPRPHFEELLVLRGRSVLFINAPGGFPCAPGVSSEAHVGAGTERSGNAARAAAAGPQCWGAAASAETKGREQWGKGDLSCQRPVCFSQFLCAKQGIWMLHRSADEVGWCYTYSPDWICPEKYVMKLLVC